MKGQNRIKRGSGFRGILAYVLDHDSPEYVGGTLPLGSFNQMTREFVALAKTRNDIQKPVWHNSLRLPEGEQLSNKIWGKIAIDYMKQLGFDDSAQWIAFKHNKSDGEHIHIIANRILPAGHIYLGQNENLKSTAIIAELEKKYHLTVTKSIELDNDNKIIIREKSAMKKSEQEKMNRTGQLSERVRLQRMLDNAIENNPTVTEFVVKLNSAGVIATPNIASTGRMNGFSFAIKGGDLAFSGSKLGRKYTWSNLLERGLQYDVERDAIFLSSLKHKQAEPRIDDTDENAIIYTASPQTLQIDEDEDEEEQLQQAIDRDYEKRANQYFCIATGKLAFTEEADRIICHEVTPEAISAQTKLAKIKFGNEFISRGSEKFRRESWMQAALHGCLDHGYQPDDEDISELKRRLSELERKPSLHQKIAVLLDDEDSSSSSSLQSDDLQRQLDNNQLAVSEKEQALQALFTERKRIDNERFNLSREDRTEIKKQAYQSIVPVKQRNKVIVARKKVRELKEKLEQSNNLFKKIQLKNQLKNAETDLTASRQVINTPEIMDQQNTEIKRLSDQAEQYYQNLRTRKHRNIKNIDERIAALTDELKISETINADLIKKVNSNNDPSKQKNLSI